MPLFSNCMERNNHFNISIQKVSVFEMPAIIRCMKLIMESIKPNVKTLVPNMCSVQCWMSGNQRL